MKSFLPCPSKQGAVGGMGGGRGTCKRATVLREDFFRNRSNLVAYSVPSLPTELITMPFRLALTKGLPQLKVGKRSLDFFQSNRCFPPPKKIPLFTGQTRVHSACYVCGIPCLLTNESSFMGDSCLHPTPSGARRPLASQN